MRFEETLQEGRFIKRYKRFFTDIEFNGKTIVAHCPNTGSMKGLKNEGSPCLFSTTDDPKRKLKHTLQAVKTPTSWVGVNTGLPNKLVMELFKENPLKHWKKFDSAQAEVKISDKSRIDMVLWNSKDRDVKKWSLKNLTPPLHLIEIKNVTLAEDGVAMFPDAVTTRGQKHLDEMMELMEKGYTCEMVYVVQRQDCKRFKTADEIDPD
ncbi:MAG: DNA/RNA nuclease SfsA, partial [Bdellovibrionales bacterium]|nr:DNA/RNA nuclease SfsA [Bdellovibrionales bacterium]